LISSDTRLTTWSPFSSKVNCTQDLRSLSQKHKQIDEILVLVDHLSCPEIIQGWKRIPGISCIAFSEHKHFSEWCQNFKVKSLDSTIKMFIHPGQYYSGVGQTISFLIGNLYQLWQKKNILIAVASNEQKEKTEVVKILKEFKIEVITLDSSNFPKFTQIAQNSQNWNRLVDLF
jgi:ribosomal protein L30E